MKEITDFIVKYPEVTAFSMSYLVVIFWMLWFVIDEKINIKFKKK